jgi:hypothetical protein
MADKKYLSKIKKDGKTIYIKDEEARAAIQELDPQQAASAATCESIIDELI